MIREAWSGVVSATAFLTVLSTRRAERRAGVESPRWTTPFFPLVGLGIGTGLAAFRAVLPAEGFLSAALVLAAWTAVTGGFHEDGWTDCADAALPPVERTRRLEILKDPRVGAHGLAALLLLMIVRFAAVLDVPWWALIAPPVIGRWAMVLSLGLARPLRPMGLGATMARRARPSEATVSAVGVLALGAAGLATLGGEWLSGGVARNPVPIVIAAGALAGLACATAVGVFLHRRLGGLSGDGHGAVGLAAETGALCAAALLLAGRVL